VAFGLDVTHRFLDNKDLDVIVINHEMKDEGYEVCADRRLTIL